MERGGGVEAPDKGGDVVISDLERSGETVRGALSSAGLRRQLPRWAAAISGPQSIIRRRKSRSIEFGDWLARFPNPCRLWSYSGWLNRSGGKQRPSQQFGGGSEPKGHGFPPGERERGEGTAILAEKFLESAKHRPQSAGSCSRFARLWENRQTRGSAAIGAPPAVILGKKTPKEN